MTKEETLKSYLNGFPGSYHPYDLERLVRYILACVEDGSFIDSEVFEEDKRFSDELIGKIYMAYDCIRIAVDNQWLKLEV